MTRIMFLITLPETHGTFKNLQGQSPFQNGRFKNNNFLIFYLWACGLLCQK